MPHAWAFCNAFGLRKGQDFAGRKIHSALATHEEIKRFHEYRYAVTVTLLAGAIKEQIPASFEDQVVESQYGSPYRCTLELTSVKGSMVHLVGHAYRM